MDTSQEARVSDGQAKPPTDVAERLEHGEQHQLQPEAKPDKNARPESVLEILKRIKRHTYRPGDDIPAVDINIRPRTVQTSLRKLRRSLGKSLRKFKQAQGENGLLENEEADGENPSLTQKKRPVSHFHNHESAAATKRARNTRYNTADEGLSCLAFAPLRLPEANPTAVLQYQKRAKKAHHTTVNKGLLALQSEPLHLPEANPAASLRFQNQGRATKAHHHTTVDGSDRLLATSFLDFLKQMDCTRDTELLRLQDFVQCSMSCEFPLCTEVVAEGGASTTTWADKVEYVLKVGGSALSAMVGTDHTARPGQPPPDVLVKSLGVLGFCLDAKTFKRVADNDVRRPGYLVALGEVYAVHRSRDRGHEVGSTGFLVLMEVSSCKKSLWMVYRYEARLDRTGPIEFGDQRESVFTSIPGAFDTVCLLDDIRDWKSSVEDMISMDRFPDALPDGDFDILRPTFCVPELASFRAAMRKGWE